MEKYKIEEYLQRVDGLTAYERKSIREVYSQIDPGYIWKREACPKCYERALLKLYEHGLQDWQEVTSKDGWRFRQHPQRGFRLGDKVYNLATLPGMAIEGLPKIIKDTFFLKKTQDGEDGHIQD